MSAQGAGRGRVAAAVVCVGVVLGGNMVALKIAIRASDPATVQALSTALAAGCLVIWARARGISVRPGLAGVRAASLTAVPLTIGSSLAMAFGLQHVDAGLAAILTSVTPIVSLIIGRALGDSGSWHGPLGVVLGVIGVVVVSWGAVGSGTSRPASILLVVLGSFCWALGMVGMRLGHGAVPSVVLVAWQLILGTPVLIATAWFATSLSANWSWGFVVALVYAGLLAKALSFLLQLWTVSTASMLAASSVAFLVPIFGTIAGVVFFHESVRVSMAAGSLMILAGVAFVAHDRGRVVEAAAPAT